MNRYIAQKAHEALEAMCSKKSLTKRLRAAKLPFIFVSSDYYLAPAPEQVRESIRAFVKCKIGKASKKTAALAEAAICSSLVEFGRQDALLSLSLKRKRKPTKTMPKPMPIAP